MKSFSTDQSFTLKGGVNFLERCDNHLKYYSKSTCEKCTTESNSIEQHRSQYTISNKRLIIRVKNKQEKLYALPTFSIETGLADSVNFDDIIETFVSRKVRNL